MKKKFKYFVTLLCENCIIDKCDTVDFLLKIYNKNLNIEYKLIVYALDNIVNNVKVTIHFIANRKQMLKI